DQLAVCVQVSGRIGLERIALLDLPAGSRHVHFGLAEFDAAVKARREVGQHAVHEGAALTVGDAEDHHRGGTAHIFLDGGVCDVADEIVHGCRHCERSEAISLLSLRDCFVAVLLAMTKGQLSFFNASRMSLSSRATLISCTLT